jgi:hypothetical protein
MVFGALPSRLPPKTIPLLTSPLKGEGLVIPFFHANVMGVAAAWSDGETIASSMNSFFVNALFLLG